MHTLNERLKDAFKKFTNAYDDARWTGTQQRVFQDAARQPLVDGAEPICASVSAPTNKGKWDELFAFALIIIKATTDSLKEAKVAPTDEGGTPVEIADKPSLNEQELRQKVEKELGKEQYRILDVLFLMRCRDSHTEVAEKADEWNRIQKYAAACLGRRWSGSRQTSETSPFFDGREMQLTELEATELKLILLEKAAKAISGLRPSQQTDL